MGSASIILIAIGMAIGYGLNELFDYVVDRVERFKNRGEEE